MLLPDWSLVRDITMNVILMGMAGYLVTRVPAFHRTLTYSHYRIYDKLVLGLIFGLFSAFGNWIGIPVLGALANTRIVGPIAGGLLGGPIVGVFAGLIGGVTRYYVGGFTATASFIANIAAGYISGMVYNRYGSQKINLMSVFATAMICEGLLKFLILSLSKPFAAAWKLEQVIGPPTLIANSLAAVFFVYVVRDVLHEQEKAQALSIQQVIRMIQTTSDFLQKGLNAESALKVSQIIYKETKAAAVAITDTEKILAFVGVGADHHLAGMPVAPAATPLVTANRPMLIENNRKRISCPHDGCKLSAVIDAPLSISGELVGIIKLYKANNDIIAPQEAELIQGLADFLSLQLAQQRLEQQQVLLLLTEYNMLKAQISPHFFFNTLSTIQALVQTKPQDAVVLIKDLAAYFRKTLNKGEEFVSLGEELELIGTYVRIEKARFHERVKVLVGIPEELLNHPLPAFSLQPLVGNAIRHGISIKKGGGTVRISAYRKADDLFVEIIDDGVGIAAARLEDINKMHDNLASATGAGIGIHNVHQRLQRLYGERFGLRIHSVVGQGTQVTLCLPWMMGGSGDHGSIGNSYRR